jgi:hypothetical protein
MWHQGTYRGDELIVLGHNPRNNDCMLVRLSGLPMNEQSELRRIAASRSAQQSSYLIPILKRMQSPSGQDWFTYLAQKMQQRNSPVFTLPIKEIQDSLDQDQKAIFKGYGKGRVNQSLEMSDLGQGMSGDAEFDEEEYFENGEAQEVGQIRRPSEQKAQKAVPSASDTKLDALINESRQTQQLLNTLIGVLSDKGPKPERVRRADKPATARRSRKPRSEGVSHEA